MEMFHKDINSLSNTKHATVLNDSRQVELRSKLWNQQGWGAKNKDLRMLILTYD